MWGKLVSKNDALAKKMADFESKRPSAAIDKYYGMITQAFPSVPTQDTQALATADILHIKSLEKLLFMYAWSNSQGQIGLDQSITSVEAQLHGLYERALKEKIVVHGDLPNDDAVQELKGIIGKLKALAGIDRLLDADQLLADTKKLITTLTSPEKSK